MPKRWKVAGGSKFGVDLVDDDGQVVARANVKDWDKEDDVDDMVEEFRDADIEFTNGDVKPPKARRP